MKKKDKKTTDFDTAKTFYPFPLLSEGIINHSYVDKTQPLPIIVWIFLKWQDEYTSSLRSHNGCYGGIGPG